MELRHLLPLAFLLAASCRGPAPSMPAPMAESGHVPVFASRIPNLPRIGNAAAKYIVNGADVSLPNAQDISGITGIVKSTAGTLSAGTAGTDYVLPGGVSGGQTINGDTAASGTLTLNGTANATKGTVSIANGEITANGATHKVLVANNSMMIGGGTQDTGYALCLIDTSFGNLKWGNGTLLGQLSYSGGAGGVIVGAISAHDTILQAGGATFLTGKNSTHTSVFAGDLDLSGGARNLVLDSTTGTKIGTATTQKLGFWNATAVVQPAATGTSTLTAAGVGTALKSDSTTTGGVGSTAYTVSDIVKNLKAAGILAN